MRISTALRSLDLSLKQFHYFPEVTESWYAIQTGNLVEGSFARIDDCCPEEINVFECITKLGGICRQEDYPSVTNQCLPKKCAPFTHVCIRRF